jgi:hypothetical protein
VAEPEFKKIKAEIVAAFGIAQRNQAEELLRRAKMEVPVGTPEESGLSGTGTAAHPPGALRASGRVDLLASGTYQVSFNTPYATKQHEAQHFKHRIGKAKYLEDPLKEMIPTWEAEIAEEMDYALGGAPEFIRVLTRRGPGGRFAGVESGVPLREEFWRGPGALMRGSL